MPLLRCRAWRRRAVRHARRALDALEELKLALLSGSLESSALLGLKAAAAGLKEGSGDDKLDQVFDRAAGGCGIGQSRHQSSLK
jgi:hypothetical protein